MKKFLVLVASFLGALFIVMGLPALMNRSVAVYSGRDSETSAVSQSILRIDSEPHTVQKIYNAGQLIGVLSSQNRLNAYLKQVYADDYAEAFPDSSVALGKDVYVEEEQSYFVYQNVDGKPHTAPAEIKANLIAQLTSSVRWTQCVQNMIADGADDFTECGPGKALQGMIAKINKEVSAHGIE